MFIQSSIFEASIKNNLTKFLTLSRFFVNFEYKIVNVSLFRWHYFVYGGYYKYRIITGLNNYHMF